MKLPHRSFSLLLLGFLVLSVLIIRVTGQCPALEQPDNGSLFFPGGNNPPYGLGVVVLYICNEGYGIASGTSTRFCNGFSWSGSAATCEVIICESLPSSPNALIVYIGDESNPHDFGTAGIHICLPGYYATGDVIRHCGGHGSSVNGNWDGTPASCLVVECDSLSPPENGAIVHSDPSEPHAYLSTATYSCNHGYRLSGGDMVRMCDQSALGPGEWDGTASVCDPLLCPTLSNPPNGRWDYTPSDTPYEVGTVATLTCSTGHLLSGIDVRNCMSDSAGEIGIWDGTDSSSCIAIICNTLTISNGAITYSTTPDSGSYSFGTTASYTCNDGFYLQGSETRSCGGDGQNDWGGNSPICEPVTCDPLSPPDNGLITYSPDTTAPFDYQTTAIYSCNSGFGLSGGDRERTCVGSRSGPGEWDRTAPRCDPLVCLALTPPVNGRITYSNDPYVFETVATYACDTGFGLNGGNSERRCGGDGSSSTGTWDGAAPTCEAIMCERLDSVENGGLSFSPDSIPPHDYLTVVDYICNEGFYRQGARTRQCRGDGSSVNGFWNGVPALCLPVTCSDLPLPSNGLSVTYSPDTTDPYSYLTMATYTCNPGFGLSGGDNTRSCEPSSTPPGEWSGTAPSCTAVSCNRLGFLGNGGITYSIGPDVNGFYDYGTIATHTCNQGYFLEGNELRECESDGVNTVGTWSGTHPVCSVVRCPPLFDPVNGMVSFTTADLGFMTMATYSCDTGYGLSGDRVRDCVGSIEGPGEWSGTDPTCIALSCSALTSPSNGRITYSTDTTAPYDFGTVARFECDSGFARIGDVTRTCGGDDTSTTGVWSGSTPTCAPVLCPSLGSLANAQLSYNQQGGGPYQFGTTVAYICNEGFFLEGNPERTCEGTTVIGTWSGTDPVCTPVTCSSLGVLGNGVIDYNSDSTDPHDFGTMATYRCITDDYGLSTSGDSVRVCSARVGGGGTWSGTAPTCEVIVCPSLADHSNGRLTYNIPPPYSGPEYVIGTSVTHSCVPGFYLDGNEFRTCTGNSLSEVGTWTGTQPRCLVVECSALTSPTNGIIVYSDPDATAPYAYDSTATYRCKDGFALSASGNRVRTCSGMIQGGVWSGTAPTCEPIQCPRLPIPGNGVITFGPDQTADYDFGTVAQYSCNVGYYLQGNQVRSCGGDGTSTTGVWSGSEPICNPIICPSDLPRPSDGIISYSSGTPYFFQATATYSCNPGFALIGDRVRTCVGSTGGPGVWDGTAPTCQPVFCQTLVIPANAQIFYSPNPITPLSYEYGTRATYTCSAGFGQNGGNALRMCGGDDSSLTGVWSGNALVCDPIQCPALNSINNGVISYSLDTTDPFNFGTVAFFMCNEGLFLEGTTRRTCGGTEASIVGNWDLTQPVCTEVTCPRLNDPTNGLITYATDITAPFDYQTAATYSCDFGFRLSGGNTVRTCISSSTGPGEWDGSAPVCEALMCSSLSEPANGGITYSTTEADFPPYELGTIATYFCDIGYGFPVSMLVVVTATCESDEASLNGVWSGARQTCSPISCSDMDLAVDNAVIAFSPDTASPYDYGTVASYSCNEGYYLVGNEMRTCTGDNLITNGFTNNGVWNGRRPSCEPITCSNLPAPDNGRISYQSDTTVPFDYQTIATYSCNSGFGLSTTNRERTCVGSSAGPGEWSGTAPTCIAVVCTDLSPPSNGWITYSPDTTSPYDFGTVATYSCDSMFGLSSASNTRDCIDGDGLSNAGTWSGNAPTCEVIICPALSGIENGIITTTTPIGSSLIEVGSEARHSCNEGFYLDGAAVRNCIGDSRSNVGTWDGSAPLCEAIICPTTLTSPSFGSIQYSSPAPFYYQDTATYRCFDELGYGLSGGDRVRACVGSSSGPGEWSGNAPMCEPILCSALTAPANGGLVYASDSTAPFDFGTMATIMCDTGYGMVSSSIRTCTGDGLSTIGVWEGNTGSCDAVICSSLGSINNGVISYSSTGGSPYSFGVTATYVCNVGFFLEGNPVRTCMGTTPVGQWSGTNPACSDISCPTLPSPSDGFIDYSDSSGSLGFLTTATYGCNLGFGLTGGDRERTCRASSTLTGGEWSGVAPTCGEIMCPALSPPAMGSITYTTDSSPPHVYGTIIHYICDPGYGLSIRGSRTCSGDRDSATTVGYWLGTEPTCEPIVCDPLDGVDNAVIVYSPDITSPFDLGTIATYNCNDGFYLSAGDSTRTCTGDHLYFMGTWEGEAATCTAIECPRLTAPAQGFIDFSPPTDTFPYDYLTMATFRCQVGYRLANGDPVQTCEGSSLGPGEWTGTSPICKALMCPQLPNPMNGIITYRTTNTMFPPFEIGAEAEYSCYTGFGVRVIDDSVRTCEIASDGLDGVWSGEASTCTGILCPALSPLDNGVITYSPDNVEPFEFSTEATHTCNTGYDLVGDVIRNCGGDGSGTINGEWNNSPPACILVTCEELTAPTNGLITYFPDTSTPFDYQTTATYSCDTGYGLSGGSGIPTVCVDATIGSGEWSGDRYTCEPIQCPPLTAPTNGDVEYSAIGSPSFSFGTVGTYTCDRGFGINGERSRTCHGDDTSVTGFWTGEVAACEVIICSSLGSISNGRITYSPDSTSPFNFETVATHACNEGFYLDGNSRRTCEADGSLTTSGRWNGTRPACSAITCSSLSAPANGLITYATDTTAPFDYQTTATYSCNSGYGLSGGSEVRNCVGSTAGPGEWDGEAPTCEAVMCSTGLSLANGRLSYAPDTTSPYVFGTVATHICDTGFGIVGNEDRVCEKIGTSPVGVWSGSTTTCGVVMCPTLPSLDNGQILITYPEGATTIDYGSVASHVCDSGYYLDGNPLRNCIGGGSSGVAGVWDGAPPTCRLIECSALTVPSNGRITFDSDSTPPHAFTTSATYSCDIAYGLAGGDSTRQCAGSAAGPGMWTGTAPICEAVMCSALPAPDNGQIVYSPALASTFGFGDSATYICDPGFGLSGGFRTRDCLGDGVNTVGTWSGSAPLCLAITCSTLPSISDGSISYSPDSTTPFDFGTIASHACIYGFYLASGTEIRTCGGDGLNTVGEWNGETPTCEVIICSALPSPPNGYVDYSPDSLEPFDIQTTATYGCNEGFGLFGGDLVRTCLGSTAGPGEWTGIASICIEITCSSLTPPTNGQIDYNSDAIAPHDFGTVATYQCSDGFNLVGDSMRTCRGSTGITGVWSGGNAICEAILCDPLSSINNGAISYGPDAIAPYDYRTVANFSCAEGFQLDGDSERTCTNDTGSDSPWTGASPVCSAILCPSLPDLNNGIIEYTETSSDTFNFQTMATYSCDTGYGLSGGDRVRTCVGSSSGGGEWTGTPATCGPILCPTLPAVTDGYRVFFPDTTSPYDYATVVTYSCDSGLGINGAVTRTCGGDGLSTTGVWSDSAPTCDRITCPLLPAIANGRAPSLTNAQGGVPVNNSVAMYSCNEGYFPRGDETRTCFGDGVGIEGSWTGMEPTCLAITCFSLSAPANGLITYATDTIAPFDYQTAATYSCNSGYGLSGGSRERTCVRSPSGRGVWDGTAPTCESITCSDLADIFNGFVAYSGSSPHQFGDVATYTCDTGYVKSHSNSRVCGGDGLSPVGIWSGAAVICNIIQCPALNSLANGLITITFPAGLNLGDFGSVARHACNYGYYLDGNQLRNCIGDGTSTVGYWDGTEPNCREIECPELTVPANGLITFAPDMTAPHTFTTSATYSCDPGFGLNPGGGTTRLCASSSAGPGVWTGSAPDCPAITCFSSPSITNGRISYSSDTTEPFDFGTTATYICDDGYRLDGGGVRICDGDGQFPVGSWTGTVPNCVDVFCSSLPDLANGLITHSPDTTDPFSYLTTATYQCDSGYGLGPAPSGFIRTCGTTGEWSGDPVRCDPVVCAELDAPDNGQVTYASDITSPYDFGTVATYVCDTGFGLSSVSRTRICRDGDGLTNAGVWSGSPVTCEPITCPALSSIDNGMTSYSTSEISSFSFGAVASFSCDDGFYIDGNSMRTCTGTGLGVIGSWTDSMPTCPAVMCDSLTNPTNGIITYSGDTSALGFMDTATYSCNSGYGLSGGDRVRTCERSSQSPGEWSGTASRCEPIMCIDLSSPDNGRVTYSTGTTSPYDFGTVATYVCDTGFGVLGGASRVCEGNGLSPSGVWSRAAATCEAIICNSLPVISNGTISYDPDTDEPFDFGTEATYSCDNGFFFDGNEMRTCGGDGSSPSGLWSGTNPICSAIVCPPLFSPDNGLIEFTETSTDSFNFQTMATYSCNTGYGLSGGDRVRTCVGSTGGPGEWSGAAPACEEIMCNSISPISNGDITYSPDMTNLYSYGTLASYSCEVGLGISGPITRTCGGDGLSTTGVWSGPPSSCRTIFCPLLPGISNGILTLIGTVGGLSVVGTETRYTCNSGYYRQGDRVRTCMGVGLSDDGMWSGMEPSCIEITCSSLTAPANGLITYATDTTDPFDYQTTATYSCNSGYGLSGGSEVRTCTGTGPRGVWSGSAPTCETITCADLPDIVSGEVEYSGTSPHQVGDTASYVCDSGYGLVGGGNRVCSGDGSSSLGAWSGTASACENITCTSLTTIMDGAIRYSPDATDPFDFGTTATYSCRDGYFLIGNRMRICAGDGSSTSGMWGGSDPFCTAIVCESFLAASTNQIITYTPDTTPPFAYLATATYSCEPGFRIEGGDTVRTCVGSNQGFGVWNGTTFPTCEPLNCSALSQPENGQIGYSDVSGSAFELGTTATYSCKTGYGLSGVLVTRTCQSDDQSLNGEWSGEAPTCIAITCPTLSLITNGVISYTPDTIEPFDFGTNALYSCGVGYYLQGSSSRSCEGDGTSPAGVWSGSEPRCIEITCPSLMAPTNGFISYSSGVSGPFDFRTTATYDCNTGYGLSGGDTVRSCGGPTGQWSGTPPICEPVVCAELPAPDNGRVVFSSGVSPGPYDFGTVATYFCDSGFGLDGGDNTRSCSGGGPSTSGTWTGIAPTCEVITCPILPPIDNGMISFSPDIVSPYNFSTSASYSCDLGFFLDGGDQTRTCNGDGSTVSGSWTGIAPRCSEIVCDSLSAPTNGFIRFATDTTSPFEFSTTATYGCDSGYGLSGGGRVRTCVGSTEGPGDWSGTAPTCRVITCVDLPLPDNGQISYSPSTSSHEFGAMATYECDTGFGLSDVTVRECVGDDSSTVGTWDGSAPTCSAIICDALPPIMDGELTYSNAAPYEYNTVAVYTCDEGFSLEGPENRNCTGDGLSVNGIWDQGTPICSIISCPMLDSPDNGFITFSQSSGTAQFRATAVYSCNTGFGISSGNVNRTCQESITTPGVGEWTGTAVTCQTIICPDLSAPDNGRVSYSSVLPFGFGTVATFECDPGFGIVGSATSECTGESTTTLGTWTTAPPACEAVVCFSLVADVNGMIAYHPDATEPFDFGTAATYSCNDGFFLEGDQVRDCYGDGTSTNGTWTNAAPVCSDINCGILTVPSNGIITYRTDTTAPFDYETVATYSCDTGYGLSGGNRLRVCLGSPEGPGEWSGTAPTCEVIMCTDLPAPDDGRVTFSPDITSSYDFGTVATYMCDTGFGISGGNVLRTCTGDGLSPNGVWTGAPPSCNVTTCGSLTSIGNGSISYGPDTVAPFDFGTVATHECNMGYFLDGIRIRTCVGDGSSITGQWSGNPPICPDITCSDLTPPTNGYITFATDTTAPFNFQTMATYICNTGYGLSGGDRVRACIGSTEGPGEWSGTAPTCEAIMCSELPDPDNGYLTFSADFIEPFDFGTMATYACYMGFDVALGNGSRVCDGNGLIAIGFWTGTTPTCTAVTCPVLTAPENGQVSYSDTMPPLNFGTTATYSCDSGYGISGGDMNRMCADDDNEGVGVWTQTPPICEPIMCTELPSPDNGGVTYSTGTTSPYDFGTVATYVCDTGFGISGGNRMRTCGGLDSSTVGTWSGAAVTCDPVTCDALDPLNNGLLSYAPDTIAPFDFGTNATHTCNEGFYLNGRRHRACNGDGLTSSGSWTASPPVCLDVVCLPLPSPVNGFITFSGGSTSSFQFMTNATYGCDSGYGLSGGDRVRTCVSSPEGPGDWSGTAPTCEVLACTNLSSPDNGRVTYSTDTTSPYDFGTVATYICDSGFGISGGNSTRTCGGSDRTTAGSWSGEPATCDTIVCEMLEEFSNGLISYGPDTTAPFDFATNATYTCDEGYFLNGLENRTCTRDGRSTSGSSGTWSGSAPQCLDIVCPPLSSPANGLITFSGGSTSSFQFITNATYSCDSGYRLSGGDRVRTCVESPEGPGEWDGDIPTCEALMCDNLPTPDNGRVIYSTNMSSSHDFGTVAIYMCDTGYGVSGGDRMRTCRGTDISTEGTWNGLAATCDPINCDTLPVVTNGLISYEPDTTVPFNFTTNATYTCNEGYFLSGMKNRTCTGDGLTTSGYWTGATPLCLSIVCTSLVPSPENGFITFSESLGSLFQFMTSATYSCDTGYGLSGGDRVRTCVGSTEGPGEWSGDLPTCEVLTCVELPAPLNGTIVYSTNTNSTYDFGTMATYVCDAGFGLIGTEMRTCNGDDSSPNGEWTGMAALCEVITCPELGEVDGGTIDYSSGGAIDITFGTVATHSCNEGFYLFGEGTRVCRNNATSIYGVWDTNVPVCVEVTCDELPDPTNGLIDYTTGQTGPFNYQTVAIYRCSEGYGLSGGNAMRTCTSSPEGPGVWNGTAPPTCEALMCTNLSAPVNGSVFFSTDPVSSLYGFATVATYVCNAGYGIVEGTVLRTCRGDGLTPNGTWTGMAPSCGEIFCSSLTSLENGTIIYSPDAVEPFDFRTEAFHSCNEGYYLQGNQLRTCTGDGLSLIGSWNGFTPICREITCPSLQDPGNGYIEFTVDTTSPLPYLTTASYHCNPGFSHLGGDSLRTCIGSNQGPGEWNGTAPTCQVITCSELPTPINGFVTYTPDETEPFDYLTTASYSCNTGYGLFGEDNMRSCIASSQGGGEWNGTAPICDGHMCPDPPPLTNGQIIFSNDTSSPFEFGTIATYICDTGFSLSGETSRYCDGADSSLIGTWTGDDPSCSGITCSRLPFLSNGVTVYSPNTSDSFDFGTTATHSCLEGFYLTGNETRTCGGNGSTALGVWEGTPALCSVIECEVELVAPLNGFVDFTSGTTPPFNFLTSVTYRCEAGYRLVDGDRVRSCVGSTEGPGEWSGTAPTCEAITCGFLDFSNEIITYSPDSEVFPFEYGTTATYSCNTGHFLAGNAVRTCGGENYTLENDKWNGTNPVCQEIKCLAELAPTNGSITYDASSTAALFDFGTTLRYSCDSGYRLSGGGRMRTCVGPGEWSGIPPTCEVIYCSELTPPIYGSLEYSTNLAPPFKYLTTVVYSCQAGLGFAIGNSTRVCGGSSSIGWSGVAPICEPILCPDLEPLENGTITFLTDKTPPFELGTHANHTCNPLYQLNVTGLFNDSSYVRKCEGNYSSSVGRWSGYEPVCIRKDSGGIFIYNPRDWLILVYVCIIIILLILLTCIFCVAIYTICLRRRKKKKFTPAPPPLKKKPLITPSLDFINPVHSNEFSLQYEPEVKVPLDDGNEFQTESISFV